MTVLRDNDVIGVNEIAQILGKSPTTVFNYINAGRLTPVHHGGKGKGNATTCRRREVMALALELEAERGEDLSGSGKLYDQITREADANGIADWRDLTVMSYQNDPYRYSTKLGHEKAKWFAEMVDRYVPAGRTIHIRGLHYILSDKGVYLPDGMECKCGKQYKNNNRFYVILGDLADAARWLDYIPFNRIVDHRNARPEIFTFEESGQPDPSLFCGHNIGPIEYLKPSVNCPAVEQRQPYHIVMVGEKSSLKDVLSPIAKDVRGELWLPTGELSNAMIWELEDKAADDGRPLILLYFSDLDPSGYTMPVTCARKLQALLEKNGHSFDIELYPVALSLKQVIEYGLPDTPLKETEKRREKWMAAMHHEQTEIDSLCALHPEIMEQIARDAVKPFFDFTLAGRVKEAQDAWYANANQKLQAHPRYLEAVEYTRRANAQYNDAAALLREVNSRSDALIADVLTQVPTLELPEPEITDEPADEPLFTTDDGFVRATQKLIDHRTFTQESDDEDEDEAV